MDQILEKIYQFTHEQYTNEKRLEARMQIYRFGEHETDFYQWIFNHLDFKNVESVLDLGCGNGALWQKNLSKIPEDITIVLTDISEGMVNSARKVVGEKDGRFKFRVTDASHTTFSNAAFQMIIANHMLYHIEDKIQIFTEIKRLLSENSYAYASTLSMNNFRELINLALEFSDRLVYDNDVVRSFNLENGEEVLSGHFNVVDKYIYQNDVIVKDSQPLLLYLASIYEGKQLEIYIEKFNEFRSYVESIIKEKGEIRISNKVILFKFESP